MKYSFVFEIEYYKGSYITIKKWYADDTVFLIEYFNSKGDRHREDGPAIQIYDGFFQWWNNGKIHREDGPAVYGDFVNEEYWIRGKKYSKYSHKIIVKSRRKILDIFGANTK